MEVLSISLFIWYAYTPVYLKKFVTVVYNESCNCSDSVHEQNVYTVLQSYIYFKLTLMLAKQIGMYVIVSNGQMKSVILTETPCAL